MSDVDEFFKEAEIDTRANRSPRPRDGAVTAMNYLDDEDDISLGDNVPIGKLVQYAFNGSGFSPTSKTIDKLTPGIYSMDMVNHLLTFVPRNIKTDNLMRLPDSKSDMVINRIKNFWTLKEQFKHGNEFASGGFLHKIGLMLFGPPGCHAKGQGILMYNGTIKNVEDIVVGELLMGPDSQPREVLKLCRGTQQMAKITPTKGEPFIVNLDHILSLMPSGDTTLRTPINMSVKDFLKQSEIFQCRMKLYRTGIDFHDLNENYEIPPYILGAWLGDGHSHQPSITSLDPEIINVWKQWGQSLGLTINESKQRINTRVLSYNLSSGLCPLEETSRGRNMALNLLKSLNLINNKHIPHKYLIASREKRLELLAGLIDTDGSNGSNCFDFITKHKQLAEEVTFLARGLGFAAYMKESIKGCTYKGEWKEGLYYRIGISGDLSTIPTLLPRKQANARQQIKDVRKTGFEIDLLDEDDYYGFILDKDHLYLMSDFTVTHNSGKTCTVKFIMQDVVERGGIVMLGDCNPVLIQEGLLALRSVEPEKPVVVVFEDFDELIQKFSESLYLSLLDGEGSVDNALFIATTNYPSRFDPRMYSRPGRFSDVIKIGMPTAEARRMYLQHKLKKADIIEEIVSKTENFSLDHLKHLILGTYFEGRPLDDEIKRLRALFKPPKDDNGEVSNLGIGVRFD